jgi:hypothetical protein
MLDSRGVATKEGGQHTAIANEAGSVPMMLKFWSAVFALVGLAWLALIFSSHAVLIGEQVKEATLHKQLVCTYFSGTRSIRKEYWYSPSDTFGRAACPRWETVRQAPQ